MGKKGFVVLGMLGIIAAIHRGRCSDWSSVLGIEKKKATKQGVVVQQSEN